MFERQFEFLEELLAIYSKRPSVKKRIEKIMSALYSIEKGLEDREITMIIENIIIVATAISELRDLIKGPNLWALIGNWAVIQNRVEERLKSLLIMEGK